MSAKKKFRSFFALLRDHSVYLAIGAPTLFLVACVYLILAGKSFLIAVMGAVIFVAIVAYEGSLFLLGTIFFSEEGATRLRKRRRRQ